MLKLLTAVSRVSRKHPFLLVIVFSILLLVVHRRNNLFLRFLSGNDFKSLSFEVQEFLQTSNKSTPGFEPILLEPILLERLLREEERSLLLKRNLMPKLKSISSFEGGIQLIAFGIFHQSLAKLQNHSEEICKQWVGFKCETVYSQKRNESSPNKVASHFFLLMKKTLIHLVVLFKRHQFIRIEAVPQNKRKPFGIHVKDHFSFGTKEQAFDSISVRKVKIPFHNIIVSVPEESDHFLAQMESSEFIECTRASKRQQLPPIPLTPFERKAKEGIIQMKNMMKQVKVAYWISSGTLLGWYRECGIIRHTTDVDFATWSEFATPEITEKMKNFCPKLRLFQIFGVYEDGYEMSFSTQDNLKLDLFYAYKVSESTVKMSVHVLSNKSYVDNYYPKFDLCSGDLLGYRVSVPCTPEAFITAEYGTNWTIPVKVWSYYKSAFNLGPMKKWPHDRPQRRYPKCSK